MELSIYQVDAFTDRVFGGNPAAIVPLKEWLPDETLQKIALENNLSETAFFVPTQSGFHLRWFTPTVEINLCGHATLATSWVIYNELGYNKPSITFESLSGQLTVTKKNDALTLDFPIWPYEKMEIDLRVSDALGVAPIELYKAPDWVAVYDDPNIIKDMVPDLQKLSEISECRGIIVTAPGGEKEFNDYDFVSRWFGPNEGIDEDPVTGSAHCVLTPYWSKKLGKNTFKARQVSARGGDLTCELKEERVFITGTAKLYMKGTIYV